MYCHDDETQVSSIGRVQQPRSILVAVCILLCLSAAAGAKDFAALTRVLYAIDLAEQSTNLCRSGDRTFLAAPVGPLGGVHDYQLHIKGEVLAGLDRGEAATVSKAAADRALADIRKSVEPLELGDGELASAPLARWCADTAEPVVRKVVTAHEKQHAEIDRLLETAKR